MKLLYLSQARFPSTRAHSYQVVQMCEALASIGLDVELLYPRRINEECSGLDPWEYYHLRRNFRARALPCLDLAFLVHWQPALARPWFLTMSTSYAWVIAWTLAAQRDARGTVVYCRDMYTLLGVLAARSFRWWPVFFEAHTFSPLQVRGLCRLQGHLGGMVVLTQRLKDLYVEAGFAAENVLVAPDGVNLDRFRHLPSQSQARQQLGLPETALLVCYTGQLFPWKGVDTLVESARYLPEQTLILVGGRPDDLARLQSHVARSRLTNVSLLGPVPPSQVPLYQAAADVLVLPNSGRELISTDCTSPLKLFEYMAAERPIVASDLPSLREILRHRENALLVRPDDARALAERIQEVLAQPELAQRLAAQARKDVQRYTWRARAARIWEFINRRIRAEEVRW